MALFFEKASMVPCWWLTRSACGSIMGKDHGRSTRRPARIAPVIIPGPPRVDMTEPGPPGPPPRDDINDMTRPAAAPPRDDMNDAAAAPAPAGPAAPGLPKA